MRIFKLSRRPNDWVVIGIWHCKYDPSTRTCGCCVPKHVFPPSVLKHPSSDFREYFRQTDSIGKSQTPRGSKHSDRRHEPRNCKT